MGAKSFSEILKSLSPLAAWASLNGWSPKGVAKIRSVAADVLVGKAFGGSPAAWQADIVEKLRKESGVERGR